MSQFRARDLVLVPNLLSGARVPLAALFPLVARKPSHALAVLGAAGATDMLDGFAARKLGQASPLGAVVDGIADKLFAASVLGTMLGAKLLSPATALLLATRELLELPLALAVLSRPDAAPTRRDRAANKLGKLATALEFASIAAVLARARGRTILVAATAVCGAAAAASYWLRELEILEQNRRARANAPATPPRIAPPTPAPSRLPPVRVPPRRSGIRTPGGVTAGQHRANHQLDLVEHHQR